tara:strand:+ start:341 stop:1210 length:870 start_codon:yes stop_codon:yes gene_type:complete
VEDLIDALEAEIKTIGNRNLKEDGFYKITTAAALVKSYEFMKLSANHDDYSKVYFTLGSLRGICEDFIVLSFLKDLDPEERDKAIGTTMSLKVQESLKRQKLFFDNERNFQPIIQPTEKNEELIKKYKQDLKDIGERTGAWSKKTPIPKIHSMAETLGLGDFYQYFYTLSSETVHFNPRILLRMGWSQKDDMENFQFSTENFSNYYKEYGLIYSALLFIRFSTQFNDFLGLSSEFKGVTMKLEEKLKGILRWPEPVTFEEMNKEGPRDFMRTMYKVAAESFNKQSRADT